MRFYNKNTNSLFDYLTIMLSTEEILKLIPEFEKLLESNGDFRFEFKFNDDQDKHSKSILFVMYDDDRVSSYDERMKNIILKKRN